MLILGIETSCDETSMAVLEIDGHQNLKVLSNIISSQIKIHAKYGGVFPALAAREHAKNINKVLKLTLEKAELKSVKKIDLIAITKGPGLAVALIVGIAFAKTLAWKYKKPIVGVNHLEGHIYSNWLPLPNQKGQSAIRPTLDPLKVKPFTFNSVAREFSSGDMTDWPKIFPALNLIVSGGHTELVMMKSHGKYKIIGETMDDAAGEAFDKIARLLGLAYPGGPLISQEAEKFSKSGIRPTLDPRLLAREFSSRCIPDLPQIKLPRPMINSRNFDFSFSGLKTAVLYLIKKLIEESPRSNLFEDLRFDLKRVRPAIAHEAQQAIVDVLVSKTLRAAKDYKAKSVLLSGGVSANKLLRETLEEKISKELRGVKFFKPLMAYTTDNAAMIALAGYFNYAKGKKKTDFSWKSVEVNSNLKFKDRI